MVLIKSSEEWTKTTANKRIFGNFIEAGFGRQINGMWSEMIFNRSFREVPAYKIATWEWLGIEEKYYNSNAPFWHSGYEEYDWETIGNPILSHTCGSHTFKGSTCLEVENSEAGHLCGLKQQGIHLEAGKVYQLRLFAGIRGDLSEAGLNGYGDVIHSDESKTLCVQIGSCKIDLKLTTVSSLYEWTIKADKTEVVDISLYFHFQGILLLSFLSMMPEDNLGGWRRDAVEILKEAAPSVVRFPGGCFVSFYNWESSIGDRDCREPMPSFYWGGLEENDVGLNEFLQLSKLVGFEPQICFNMMTSTPFKGRQMVEYLNASEHTGTGRLRALNGYPEPYHVKLFEMDNEPGRKWTAKQYAEQCVTFAKEMRLADETIEFMMACYTYAPELLNDMLEIAGKHIQYVIYRQGKPEFVKKILPVIREYNRKNGTEIRLVNTEWLPSCFSMEPFEDGAIPTDFRWTGKITNDYNTIFSTQQVSWNYALNGAHRLLDYISYGGEFALANFNNMCNTWGQNIMEATKDTCYLSCMGQVFAFFHRVFHECTAAVAVSSDERVFGLLVQTVDEEQGVYLINHSSEDVSVELPQEDYIFIDGLTCSGRMNHETSTEKEVKKCHMHLDGKRGILPAISVVYIRRKN